MEPDPKGEPAAPDPPESTPPEPDETTTGKADSIKRLAALIIDAVIAGVVMGLLGAFLGPILGYSLGFLVAAAYMATRDGLNLDFMKGRSIGKKLVKLRPVRLDGKAMDIESSVKRNWMFAIGYIVNVGFLSFIGWLIGAAAGLIGLYECYKVITDKEGRRWGDELAGTRVIESAD